VAFMPDHAPLVILMFLGAVGVTGFAAVVAVVAGVLRRKWIALGSAGAAVATAGVYALVLTAVSVTSYQVTLPPGDWKYFCEVDCHIAYSIAGVQTAAQLGPQSRQVSAQGRFVVVRLKTWFDEHSIAPWRGNAPLVTGERQVVLVDGAGRRYEPSASGAAALGRAEGAAPALSQALRPGESFTASLVFDVPAEVRNLRLLVSDPDDDWISSLIIDHENSYLHKKIYLGLEPAPAVSSTKVVDVFH